MATQWTDKQKQVIHTRDRNLLVSASAGSGKTAVLVERIIQIITDPQRPVDIDQLLVMTFTNAAAAEMRERIGLAIEEKLQETPDSIHLQRQVTMLHHASITTIDSYCLSLLHDYFNHLDIDPDFRVGDEGELKLLQSEVMEQLLEDWYQSACAEFLEFVDAYGTGKTDARIEEHIQQVCRFAQSNPWPMEWLEECRQETKLADWKELLNTPWMEFLVRDLIIRTREMCGSLELAAQICMRPQGPESYLLAIEKEIEQLEALSWSGDFLSWRERLAQVSFGRLASIRKSDQVDPELKEQAAAIRNRVKKTVSKWKEDYCGQTQEELLSHMRESQKPVHMLLRLAEDFLNRYAAAKREKNLVDFNDLEHFALQLFVEREQGKSYYTPIANELSRQYKEILVDEYQDSNLVQETLIQSLSGERFGRPNVFMVGDVKQSIYKFRLARPELFMGKYDTFTRTESQNQLIELDQNFRSRGSVLDSINYVFYRIMTRNLGNIEYTEEAALRTGMIYPASNEQTGTPTELILVDAAAEKLEALDEERADYTVKELEARLLAQQIRKLTDARDGLKVWDKESGSYRTARYGDIVILLRSVSQWAEVFLQVLGSQGIPAYAESRTGYFDTLEVETILSLLSVIDNPMQDIPLAVVLKSPIAGLDDLELAWLMTEFKQNADKPQRRGLYGAWLAFKERTLKDQDQAQKEDWNQEPDNPEDQIYRKLCTFEALLSGLRFQATYQTVHELLYAIYEQTGYYDYVSALPGGEVRRANLDVLVERAVDYEKTRYQGLFHFVRYIEKLKKFETDFGEASLAGEQGDTVRIMSIHKSKGLEFPIVLAAGLAKRFNRQDAYQRVLIHEELGIAADFIDVKNRLKASTLKKSAIKRKMELDSMGEELRVLYVAMTRAREKLIMTAVDPGLQKRMERWSVEGISCDCGPVSYSLLSAAGCCLDWLLMSLNAPTDLIQVSTVFAAELAADEVNRQLGKLTAKGQWLRFDTEQIYSREALEWYERMFSFQYPYEAEIGLPAKLSVSELKKQGQDLDQEGSLRLAKLKAEERTFANGQGAYVGTAYHQALERLPLNQIQSEADVEQWLVQMTDSKSLPMDYARVLDCGTIYGFIQSELGRMMADAEKRGALHREQQFVFGMPAQEIGAAVSQELVLIQGVIDAWIDDPDGLVIIDYKTDKVRSARSLVKRYKQQLYYYQKALEQITGRRVRERVIYSLTLQESVSL